MNGENDDNMFTFVWKIENWRLRNYETFFSPQFNIKKFLNTTWCVKLHHQIGKDITTFVCSLERVENVEGPDEIQIQFDIVMCDNPNELTNHEIKQTETFNRGSCKKYNKFSWDGCQKWLFSSDFLYIICYMFIDRDEIKTISDDALIPNYLKHHVAKLECPKSVLEPMQEGLQCLQKKFFHFSNKCFARTVLRMEKKTITWSMEHILSSCNKKHVAFMTALSNFPDFLIKIQINEESTIEMEIQSLGNGVNVDSVISNVWLSDSDGHIWCSNEECEYPNNMNVILETKTVLAEKPTFDLKSCFLCLEIRITDGEEFSFIENTSPATFLNSNTSDNQGMDNLRVSMQNIYTNNRFCDVTLDLPNKKFKAHKAMLCVNSPVFSAMFDNEMQESKTNIISIDDIDEDVMDHMLKFMYSGTLENLQFEEILKLYEAADKYQIQSLLDLCKMYLKSNIRIENVLNLFHLSDAHGDKKLKLHVCDFIVAHIHEIFRSEEWKLFSKDNIMLSKEILEKVCMKLTGIQMN